MKTQFGLEHIDLNRVRLSLHQRLSRLLEQRNHIEAAIAEAESRIKVLDDIASWDLTDESHIEDTRVPVQVQNGDAKLLTMALGDAVLYLRQENPDISKQDVRRRLEAVGYRLPTDKANIGRAIHGGWIAAERRLAENRN